MYRCFPFILTKASLCVFGRISFFSSVRNAIKPPLTQTHTYTPTLVPFCVCSLSPLGFFLFSLSLFAVLLCLCSPRYATAKLNIYSPPTPCKIHIPCLLPLHYPPILTTFMPGSACLISLQARQCNRTVIPIQCLSGPQFILDSPSLRNRLSPFPPDVVPFNQLTQRLLSYCFSVHYFSVPSYAYLPNMLCSCKLSLCYFY